MKRFAAVLLTMLLFVAGCARADGPAGITDGPLSDYTWPAEEPEWVTLYYPSEENDRVLAFTQQLSGTEPLYETIMDALLHGTEQGYKSAFPDTVSCRSITPVQNVLYLDFSWQFAQMEPERLFACISVLVKTYTRLAGVDFINITADGTQLTLPGTQQPVLLLSAYTGSISEMLNEYRKILQAEQNGENRLRNCYALVYRARNGFLLPQSISVTVPDGDYASALAGSQLAQNSLFAEGFYLKEAPVYQAKSKKLSVKLTAPDGWTGAGDWLGGKAMGATLACLYPACTTIEVTVEHDGAVNRVREDMAHLYESVRSEIRVFVPAEAGRTLIPASLLVTRMPGRNDPGSFAEAYINMLLPQLQDSESPVLRVSVQGGTVIADLRSTYFEQYASLDSDKEFSTAFALVCSLCSYTGASKALLLEEGKMRSRFTREIALDRPLAAFPDAYLDSLL